MRKQDYSIGIYFSAPTMRVKGKAVLGYCKYDGRNISIYIDPRLSLVKQFMVLGHEIAHAIMYILGPHRDLSESNSEYFADCVGNRAEDAFMEVIERPNN